MRVPFKLPHVFAIGIGIGVALPLSAQWLDVKTKHVPLTKDGKPNLTAPAPKLPGGKPNLSGVWNSVKAPCEETFTGKAFGCIDSPDGIPIGFIDVTATSAEEVERGAKDGLPYQPAAAAFIKQRTSGNDDTVHCLPMSPVRQWPSFHPQKIVQTDEALIILDEYMAQYRQIFLDGRALPKDPFPYFKGYSVGHWDGDTLAVDTVGLKEGLWLDGKGDTVSEEARLTERIRRQNYGNLEVQITVNDPKTYTRSWTVTRHMQIALDTELIPYVCNENEKSSQHMVSK
jgi:hypothetical protein